MASSRAKFAYGHKLGKDAQRVRVRVVSSVVAAWAWWQLGVVASWRGGSYWQCAAACCAPSPATMGNPAALPKLERAAPLRPLRRRHLHVHRLSCPSARRHRQHAAPHSPRLPHPPRYQPCPPPQLRPNPPPRPPSRPSRASHRPHQRASRLPHPPRYASPTQLLSQLLSRRQRANQLLKAA